MAHLFDTLKMKDITLKNRIVVSPMCEYSAKDGIPNDWHLVHLGSRAVGGAGLVICEATAVEAIGRISEGDTGIYHDAQVVAWKRITDFIKTQGAVPGIQLAHAGRKASTLRPWEKQSPPTREIWQTVGPSDIPFHETDPRPRALTTAEVKALPEMFQMAAKRSLSAGFQVLELHAAHGYLLNQFLSPLINQRTDEYGGSFENRIRLLLETVDAVKKVWPANLPLLVRISATDWYTADTKLSFGLEESIKLAQILKSGGVDLIDVSTGGVVPHVKIPNEPGYQVPFAAVIRERAQIMTSAVGLITEAKQANEIIQSGKADLVMLAREMLRDPYWPRRAAKELGQEISVPNQYLRSW